MRVLVIGGGGHVGRIINPTLDQHHHVTHMDRQPVAGAEDRTFQGDLSDNALVNQAVQNQDAILFMAMGKLPGNNASTNWIDPAFDVNVRDQYRVLMAGLQAGVRKFILISTMSVYAKTRVDHLRFETEPPDGLEPYAMSKRLAEYMHQAAAARYPDGTFLALRFVLPLNEEQFAKLKTDEKFRQKHDCGLGPNDTRRLIVAALALEQKGYFVVHTSGDIEGRRFPNTAATELLGWTPRNE